MVAAPQPARFTGEDEASALRHAGHARTWAKTPNRIRYLTRLLRRGWDPRLPWPYYSEQAVERRLVSVATGALRRIPRHGPDRAVPELGAPPAITRGRSTDSS